MCSEKYYKDTLFHRLIPGFMIQGGDPTGTGTGGQSIWQKPFEDEFRPNLSHNARGILSMANSGPNSNKSQFFMTFRACTHLDNIHTVFGKVVGGLDVLTKMEAVEKDKKDRPKVSIKIEDSLVFVDPYKEIDQNIKAERDKAEEDKRNALAKKVVEKETLDTLKPVRSGVGKYIKTDILEKKHKISGEEELDLKSSKKQKAVSGSFGDFSSW